jgi:hypothetical protein
VLLLVWLWYIGNLCSFRFWSKLHYLFLDMICTIRYYELNCDNVLISTIFNIWHFEIHVIIEKTNCTISYSFLHVIPSTIISSIFMICWNVLLLLCNIVLLINIVIIHYCKVYHLLKLGLERTIHIFIVIMGTFLLH